ncbi:hypothetical protein [Aquincola sp. J276]|uniref:hypothetical protein n=1 Tax=Aquincola sp. J276 TaxID=2898432 RepID=UPI0021514314|nr:hypothetical protein [Aquincola sp. J276]MCR5868390.1 hypothetical protein [Aquincola sp. J276]
MFTPAKYSRPLSGALVLALAAATTLLAACGGGSDDDDGLPSNTTFNVRAGMYQLLTVGGSWTVAGRGNDNLDYQLRLSYAPGVPGIFPLDNQVYDRATQSATLSQGNASTDTVSQEIFHNAATGAVAGTRYDGTECSLSMLTGNLPTAARVGDSGPFLRSTEYADCSGTRVAGTSEMRWSVEMNRGRPYYCLTQRYGTGDLEIECFEAAGTEGRLGSRARVRLEVLIDNARFILDAEN